MKRFNQWAAIAVSFILLAGVPMSVNAEDLHNQLNQYQQQANQLNEQLAGQKQQVASAVSQALAIQQSVQTMKEGVAAYQKSLEEQQKTLASLQEKQKKLEAERQKRAEALGEYLRSNYEEGESAYLQVLMQATSITDFLDRLEQISLVYGTYSQLQDGVAVACQNLNNQEMEIQAKNVEIQATLQQKQVAQQNVQQALDKQNALVGQLTAKEKETLKVSRSVQGQINRVQQLIAQEELEAKLAQQDKDNGIDRNSNSSGAVTTPVKLSDGAAKVLNYGSQFLGVPYAWGGTSPQTGFDCSGFVQYVFKNEGITLNRTSQMQYMQGTAVSRAELQPGDLVFFQTYGKGATHVGIYAGNNTMLNSSNGGVVYENMNNSYWAPRYYGARRIFTS